MSNITSVLLIHGMTCTACARSVESALAALPGVSSATVSVILEKADVFHNPIDAPVEKLVEAVSDAGFEASPAGKLDLADLSSVVQLRSSRLGVAEAPAAAEDASDGNDLVRLRVTGMTCAACVSSVETALKATTVRTPPSLTSLPSGKTPGRVCNHRA